MIWALAFLSALAAVPAGLRWLRIAQREHYLPPATSRFAMRWWGNGALNRLVFLASLAGVVASAWETWLGLLVPLAQIGPIGLSLRGRTSPLSWTERLRRLAGVSSVFAVTLMVAGAWLGLAPLIGLALVSLPLLVDLSMWALAPYERRLGDRWVEKAAARLRSSGARVVGLTGSYGKTTTKQYTAHLLSGSRRTVASPASFNNRMGLARAINEHLVPGTEVFVAEMGTYGPGEIAELVEWIRPEVSALISIGPVHLERFRTEERILQAKTEIFTGAAVGVVPVDDPRLAALAGDLKHLQQVITVSGKGEAATVTVREGTLVVDGAGIGAVPDGVFPLNLAVAAGVCLGLGLDAAELSARLHDLPRAEHRQSLSTSEMGFTIIDDTFNANPEGARSGLAALSRLPAARRVVVTPGMVELGPRQHEANRDFAAEAAAIADDLVIVGATNRDSLLRGSGNGKASVTVVGSREQAVAWVRAHLGQGDAVLYENDLPDHYP